MRDRRRGGFTLVELLVAIGIVAVLVALLQTSLSTATALSRRTRCLSNLRQLGVANSLYAAQFPGWNMPAYWGWSQATAPWPATTPPLIPPSGPRLNWYQSWPVASAMGATKPGNGRFAADVMCPDAPLSWDRANRDGYPIQNSYGINRTQMPGTAVAGAPDYWNAWKTSDVRQGSEKIQFVDATCPSVSCSGTFNATLRYWSPLYGERHEAPDKTNIVAYRHRRGANVLFYDGHAQWLPDAALRIDPATLSTAPNQRQWQALAP